MPKSPVDLTKRTSIQWRVGLRGPNINRRKRLRDFINGQTVNTRRQKTGKAINEIFPIHETHSVTIPSQFLI